METKKLNIRQQIEAFNKGEYASADIDTQIKAGWFDWFCSDKALAKGTISLYNKLKKIVNSSKIGSLEDKYLFFKNNCPVNGSTYNDFRICDMKSGDVLFTITPSCGHTSTKGQSHVWGKSNGFKGPLLTGTWKDVVKYFNS